MKFFQALVLAILETALSGALQAQPASVSNAHLRTEPAAGGLASANDDSGFEKIDHAATAALAIVGAGSGALVGYLIGRGGNKRVLVYEAK